MLMPGRARSVVFNHYETLHLHEVQSRGRLHMVVSSQTGARSRKFRVSVQPLPCLAQIGVHRRLGTSGQLTTSVYGRKVFRVQRRGSRRSSSIATRRRCAFKSPLSILSITRGALPWEKFRIVCKRPGAK